MAWSQSDVDMSQLIALLCVQFLQCPNNVSGASVICFSLLLVHSLVSMHFLPSFRDGQRLLHCVVFQCLNNKVKVEY